MKPEQIVKLKTGDVLICKAETVPGLQHLGVVAVEGGVTCVYHCTPVRNVTCDVLTDFLQRNEFIRVRHTGASPERFYKRYREVKNQAYHVLSFNCTHFVEYVTS